jgi:hypothetical protein
VFKDDGTRGFQDEYDSYLDRCNPFQPKTGVVHGAAGGGKVYQTNGKDEGEKSSRAQGKETMMQQDEV